jgi:hypothetical protein
MVIRRHLRPVPAELSAASLAIWLMSRSTSSSSERLIRRWSFSSLSETIELAVCST